MSISEILQSEENNQIIGGFSNVFQILSDTSYNILTNNCHGGNCNNTRSQNIYKKHSTLKGINNCHTNCISGCGNK